MTSSLLDVLLPKQSEQRFKRSITEAIALTKSLTHIITHIIDTAVALNFVVATCFVSVGMFFDLAATGKINWLAAIALFLTTWQIYIADRLIKNPEDENLEDENYTDEALSKSNSHSAIVTQHHQQILKVLVAIAVCIQVICIIQQLEVAVGVIIGLLGGLAYVIKLPVLNRRIKQIPCAKTFYVPLVCVAMALGTTAQWDWAIQHWDITVSIWILIALNALVFDIKDCDRDFAAGIYTFFNLFPYNRVLHTAIGIASVITVFCPYLSLDAPHIALSVAALGTILLLLPLYKTKSARYLTHIVEWNIALPLLCLSFLFNQ